MDAREQASAAVAGAASLTVGQLEEVLCARFPAADAEEWDRTGLLVGDPAWLVRRVAVALDPTVEAIRAAADAGANVLLTHHPAFLRAPDSFQPANSVAVNPGAGVWAAARNGVALMSFHTALDVSVPAQQMLPGLLELSFQRVLLPLASDEHKGYGQVCCPASGCALDVGLLARRAARALGCAPRVWGNLEKPINLVVTCTGATGDVARAARVARIDCLVCGEIKYHEALDVSQAGLAIIEVGHDASELPFCELLAEEARAAGVSAADVLILGKRPNWTTVGA